MIDWRDTLQRAATLSRDAARELPQLVQLLAAVESGRATPGDVTSVLGGIGSRRAGFVEALDAALRAGSRAEPGLDAARAVLAELPDLLDRMVAMPPLGPDPTGHFGATATLARMRDRERATPGGREHPSLVCPRCGSKYVDERHTDEWARRFREVRCNACGNYGSWLEGDPEEAAWERR